MSYTPPSGVLDPTWAGADTYVPSTRVLLGNFSPVQMLAPYGPNDGVVSDFEWTSTQAATPVGIDSAAFGTARIGDSSEYFPPYATLTVSWFGADTYSPASAILDARWELGTPVATAYVYAPGWESLEVPPPVVWRYQFASPAGIFGSAFGYTIIARAGEYAPSRGSLNASWVDALPYTPAQWYLPAGWRDPLADGVVRPFPIPPGSVGRPTTYLSTQYILPSTFVSSTIGSAFVDFGTHILPLLGFVASTYGQAAVSNFDKELLVSGIAPPPSTGVASQRQLPPPVVTFRTRFITPLSLVVPTQQVPAITITHEIQFLDLAGRSILPGPFGTPRIEDSSREIVPPFIFALSFGVANVARVQVISPQAWESSDVPPDAQLDINLQRIQHQSGVLDPLQWGNTFVRNQHEVVRPSGWLSQGINFPVVYNVDQYVRVSAYMDTNSDPTQWPGYYPFVENQDRYVGPSGFQTSRFSVIGNVVENAADPILPAGLDSLVFGAETFISHYTRYVGPAGWDSFYNSQYTVVYNDADVLGASGWGSSVSGRPESVRNQNRDVKQFFPYGGETVGLAFIAYAIRTITPGLFYDVPSGFPEVRLNPYPITPIGIAPPQFGATFVDERFSVISPKSTNVHPVEWVGEPIVENENKTLFVFPSDQFFSGIPKIANYVQYREIGGGDLSTFGAHLISYRTKTITPTPVAAPAIVITHRIRNLIPDPPGPRTVFPGSVIPVVVPAPMLSTRAISVSGIDDNFATGTAVVTTNNLLPRSIYDDGMLGIPAIPVPRPIFPLSIPASTTDFRGQVSNGARLSPFNMYAPTGDQTPLGYTPQPVGEPINSMAIFGRSDVSHFHRVIGPVPNHSFGRLNRPTAWGSAEFQNRRRVVAPYGLMSQRFPVPIFLGVPQYVEMGGDFGQPGIASTNEFGMHVIARYVAPEVNRTLPVRGLSATFYGTPRVELLHRTLHLTGIPHRGNPQQGLTNPWGLALVGYPRRYVITAGETTLWGSAVIEYKNRTVTAHGFSANTLDDDDIEERIEPMRVTRRNPPGGVPSIASALVFGVADVSHYHRTVLARGPYSFVSGIPRVRAASPIHPSGWDSFVAGDIDRWEAGKIKPHGDDVGSLGTPRIDRRVYVFSMSGAQVGATRVASGIRVSGLPEIGFAGPSLTDIYGCSNRTVVPTPILSAEMFGTPQGENA